MPTADETEGWLTAHKVTWRRRDVPLDEIDWATSLANQARLESIDKDVVARYAAAIDAGEVLPPIVVHVRHRRSTDQLVILGGNHRYAAHRKAGVPVIDAYLVDCPPATATVLMYEDNARHGLAPSTAERVAQALHLVATSRLTVKKAAAVVGVSQASVQQGKQLRDVDARAARLGMVRLHVLPEGTRFRLAALADDDVFEALGDLAVDARLSKPTLDKIVPHLNRLTTVEERLDAVADERDHWRARMQDLADGKLKAGQGRRSHRLRFHTAVSELLALDPEEIADCDATPRQLQQVAAEALKAARHLHRVGTASKTMADRPHLQVVS